MWERYPNTKKTIQNGINIRDDVKRVGVIWEETEGTDLPIDSQTIFM